jgi:Arc/MetJ family transcription regulator
MRTNIDIDDKLMKQAMKATGTTTKKSAVEASLRKVVQLKSQEGIRKWRGKIKWEGNLADMRASRFVDDQGRFAEGERRRKTDEAMPKQKQRASA